ncbi:hypothetical protein [Haloarchaeobius sp. TZWWS8]|uniref:hypothetical protein n=1 Tax=Haloarchaeobius sp. TZWWS8 TaxID=3446121 RepID=UPI003EC06A36
MDATFAAGITLTALGAVSYLVGIAVPYPGRAFSLTAVMVGLTLLAVGWEEPAGLRGGGE